jgi:parallel beta-helix repeat protein
VVVGCGVYYEHGISMKSGVTLRSETGDPACVTIDAQEYSRVLNCSGVDETGRVEGLTLMRARNEGSGGGVHCVSSCRVVIENCVIKNNRAGWGGGISIDCSSSPTIRNCTLFGNRAFYTYQNAGSGGGIYSCGWYTSPEIIGCVIYGNSAVVGGGIGCDPRSAIRITDCVITGNTATSGGGGVGFNIYSTPVLDGCTIAGNRAPRGGGLQFYDGSITMESSIVWGNCAGLYGDEIYLSGPGSILTASCSAIDTTGIEGEGSVTWDEGNLFSDPLFCDPEDCESAPTILGDYTLFATSPCLDAPGCGRIGALDEGCGGPIAVKRASWSAVKSLFR